MQITEPTPEQKRLLKADDQKTMLTGWVLTACAGLILWGGGILVWHASQWLKFGEWPPSTWADGLAWIGLSYSSTDMVGLQRILDWFMRRALWSLPAAVGFLACMAWITWADYESPELKDARSCDRAWKARQRYLRDAEAERAFRSKPAAAGEHVV